MMIETAEVRRRTMQAVKAKDTAPEMMVRRLAHRLGYRYRLHRRDLPGTPDLVFPARRKVILVNGCFWHGHDCARGARRPKQNANYWREKISRNEERDAKARESLQLMGWNILVIWECELKELTQVRQVLSGFLSD